MKTRTFLATGLALSLLGGGLAAQVGDCVAPATGPDVIVGSLSGISNYGGTGGVGGYSIGTTSCNTGTTTLNWIANNNQHPVIGQNFFRLENGRFEQIGMSWLKHGFTALQGSVCCSCTPNPNGTALGVGCSDPYGSSLNGSQSGLGPRFQVNAFTGAFPYPFSGQGQSGDQIYKRAQIRNTDLDPSLHPTAQYFGEGQYVAADDSLAGNGANNASYRRVNVGNFSNNAWSLSMTGATEREQPGIQAWKDADPTVRLPKSSVPGEGVFLLASKSSDNGNGTWHYEFALQNLTSDVSIGSFEVPLPAGVTITNIGFHDIDYHSGEPFDGTDWVGVESPGKLTWTTAQTFAQNPNANAIRWGSLYNFRFDADAAPGEAISTVGFFKPHSPSNVGVKIDAPVGDDPWVSLGGGTSGVAGPPALDMGGPLTPSSIVTLDLLDGPPLELALIFISFSSTPTSFLGGTLHPFPFDDLVLIGTDGAGEIHGAANFPGATSGQGLWFQVALQDLTVPAHQASLSNGVQGTVP